jgi:hypothetical protein
LPALLRDYGRFLRRHPLWWLLPPAIVMLALFVLASRGEGDVTSFVYAV